MAKDPGFSHAGISADLDETVRVGCIVDRSDCLQPRQSHPCHARAYMGKCILCELGKSDACRTIFATASKPEPRLGEIGPEGRPVDFTAGSPGLDCQVDQPAPQCLGTADVLVG
ncbi:hypothetical protein FQZ97_1076570 [compost metagenome]